MKFFRDVQVTRSKKDFHFTADDSVTHLIAGWSYINFLNSLSANRKPPGLIIIQVAAIQAFKLRKIVVSRRGCFAPVGAGNLV
jgi:hypothetical protein